MIKDNQRRLNQLHVVIDAIVLIVAYLLAYYFVFSSPIPHGEPAFSRGQYFSVLLALVPAYLIIFWIFHLYTPKRVQGRRLEAANLLKAILVGALLFSTALYLGKDAGLDFSRPLVLYFSIFSYIFEVAYRNVLRIILRSFRMKGYNQKHILLVGYSRAAQGYIDRV